LPSVWLYDTQTEYEIEIGEHISGEEAQRRRSVFFERLRCPGTYEVGGLGACTLISKKALAKGISFKKIKNLKFEGEGSAFLCSCHSKGAAFVRRYALPRVPYLS